MADVNSDAPTLAVAQAAVRTPWADGLAAALGRILKLGCAETEADPRAWRTYSPRVNRARSDSQLEDERHSIRRAMRFGMWIWPSFTLLDIYMCLVLYPGAPLALFLVCRVLVEGVYLAVYRLTFCGGVGIDLLARSQRLGFFLAALGISLMAVHLGGLGSAYMHGISIVCLVHAVLIRSPWRRSAPLYACIALAFPAVMLLAALLSPAEAREWFGRGKIAEFAANYVFVLASSVVATVCGHVVWAAREQLYRARRLGRYRLEAPLGFGGMGEVWLAWDDTLRRNVALKLLRSKDGVSAESVRRFEREARLASQLRGPNTIHIYDYGASDDGVYFIAMEYLKGTDLATLVQREGPLSASRTLNLARQVCASLSEAHRAGIVHRDIKPQNLFVTPDRNGAECLKLLDFGIAHLLKPEPGVELTREGLLMGTPAYMAPELWQAAAADVRSDIYAVGATLYYMVTGAPPVARGATARMENSSQQPPTGEPPSPKAAPALPTGLQPVVLRCLALAPADRFQSVDELLAALSGLQLS